MIKYYRPCNDRANGVTDIRFSECQGCSHYKSDEECTFGCIPDKDNHAIVKEEIIS